MTFRISAVIPAAGSGRRVGNPIPKQFLILDGIPVLVHTLKVFDSSPWIHEIILVVPPGMEAGGRTDWIAPYGLKKIVRIIPGGETRQASVYEGLMKTSPEMDAVVVHDGVRPFLSADLLQRVIEAGREGGGAIAAVPLKDTPKEVGDDGIVRLTPDRARLYLAQTPQVFPRKVLMEAYQKAYADGIKSTDDSSLVERLGYPVKIVEGAWDNIKITTPSDLPLAEKIMALRREGSGTG